MERCNLLAFLILVTVSSTLGFAVDRPAQCEPAAPRFEHALGMSIVYGCYINKVQPGSLAEQNGLQEGDLILSLNGKAFRDFQNSLDFAQNSRGAAAENGAELELLKHARATDNYDPHARTVRFIIDVTRLREKAAIGFRCASHAVVLSVGEGEPAKEAGVIPGEFIHAINNEIVANLDNAIKIDQAMHRAIQSGRVELELGRWGKTTISKDGERQRELILRSVVIIVGSPTN